MLHNQGSHVLRLLQNSSINSSSQPLTSTLMSKLLGGVRYKSKTKIPVQLHKDFPGLGLKGEVVRVFPGRMRNQLHPYNGASYVLEGKPLRLPLVTRAQAAAEEARRAALNGANLENQPVKAADPEVVVDYSELGFLNFPKAKASTSTGTTSTDQSSANTATTTGTSTTTTTTNTTQSEDLFALHNALNSLPSALNIKTSVLEDGFLAELYTVENICDHVSTLIGFKVDPAKVVFEVQTSPSPRAQPARTKALDFYGTYNVVFSISSTSSLTKKVSLLPADGVKPSVDVRPIDLPLPAYSEASSSKTTKDQTTATTKETTETLSSGSSKDSQDSHKDKKTFPWENDFISELEKRIRK